MTTMSIDYAKKLLAIQKAKRLTQKQFADMTGISLGTVKVYESGHRPARAEVMEKVLQVERFKQYTLWLMNGFTAPESGQVAPDLSGWQNN